MAAPTPAPLPKPTGSSPFASRVQKPEQVEVKPAAPSGPSKGLLIGIAAGVFGLLLVVILVVVLMKSPSGAGQTSAAQPNVPAQPANNQTSAQVATGGEPPAPTLVSGGSGPFGLLNGDMSLGSGTATGWTQVWVGSGRVDAARDTANFRSAPASLLLSAAVGNSEGQVAQLLPLQRRQPFVVGGWLMSSGTARVTYGVQFYDAANRQIQFSEILFTDRPLRWTRASLRIDPPAQAASYALVLYIAGAGQAWLDDVTVEEAQSK